MPSRQDQLHSYQYSLQRVVAALVTHDPDPQRSPLRKAGTTALVSLLIASLALLGATIYGLFTGHSNVKPNDTKVVFQEKGTGARFVYLAADTKLHPVLNYTSGLLLAEGETPELKSISTEKLASMTLGDPLGIPGAPDSLPADDALLDERWSVCTERMSPGNTPRSTVLVGHKLTDGVVAATAGTALLVRDTEDHTYLIFGNRRFAFPPDRTVETLRALGWADQQPWPVSVAWRNAVPPGPDLVPPNVPDQGARSTVDGFTVGQLVTDGVQYGVILRDGFSSITETQARLMQAQGAEPPEGVGSRYNTIKGSDTQLSDTNAANGLPQKPPPLADGTPQRLCMTLPVDAQHPDGVRIDPTVPKGTAVTSSASQGNTGTGSPSEKQAGTGSPAEDAPAIGSTPEGGVRADYVYVDRGKGAVVIAAASSSSPDSTGTVSVVTDTGRRYPLANRSLLPKLGYGKSKFAKIPSQVIGLLPEGPSLDPERAKQANPQG